MDNLDNDNEFKLDTNEDLRLYMMNQIKRVGSGKMTAAQANAESSYIKNILYSAKIDLEYDRLNGVKPKLSFFKRTENDDK